LIRRYTRSIYAAPKRSPGMPISALATEETELEQFEQTLAAFASQYKPSKRK
jgi:hypothetical protein